MTALSGKRILLVIGGGIAAYKSLDLIRRLRERGATVRCVLTAGAQQFITTLAASALTGQRSHTDLFDREDESDIGHIKLARDADLVVVAPATAKEVAEELVVTEAAVKQHLLRLYAKFRIPEGGNRRGRLANEVIALGIVRPVPDGDGVRQAG